MLISAAGHWTKYVLVSLQGRETETCVNCLQGLLAPSFPSGVLVDAVVCYNTSFPGHGNLGIFSSYSTGVKLRSWNGEFANSVSSSLFISILSWLFFFYLFLYLIPNPFCWSLKVPTYWKRAGSSLLEEFLLVVWEMGFLLGRKKRRPGLWFHFSLALLLLLAAPIFRNISKIRASLPPTPSLASPEKCSEINI